MGLLKKIFSITIDNNHKIWTIFGLKFKFKNINKPINGNKIVVHKVDGSLKYSNSYQGVDITFKGKNSLVELWEPININNSSFVLGDNCTISIKSSELSISNLIIVMQYSNNFTVSIGKNFSVNQMIMQINRINNLSINIGNDCMFSSNITLMPYDFHTIFDKTTKEVVNKHKTGINIGNHVWLCQSVAVLKDVTIPSNTIIAYGSIVTKSFAEENTIIAGNPAKIIKRNVNWDRAWIEQYEQEMLTYEIDKDKSINKVNCKILGMDNNTWGGKSSLVTGFGPDVLDL